MFFGRGHSAPLSRQSHGPPACFGLLTPLSQEGKSYHPNEMFVLVIKRKLNCCYTMGQKVTGFSWATFNIPLIRRINSWKAAATTIEGKATQNLGSLSMKTGLPTRWRILIRGGSGRGSVLWNRCWRAEVAHSNWEHLRKSRLKCTHMCSSARALLSSSFWFPPFPLADFIQDLLAAIEQKWCPVQLFKESVLNLKKNFCP